MDKSTSRKPIPPAYQFWRRRVEGQIRHAINEHPEWFCLPDAETKERCVRSVAKRVIGEIVAGIEAGDGPSGGARPSAPASVEDAVQCVVRRPAAGGALTGVPPAAPAAPTVIQHEEWGW